MKKLNKRKSNSDLMALYGIVWFSLASVGMIVVAVLTKVA